MVINDRGIRKAGTGPSRREAKKHELRERLYAAAIRLFRLQGYEQTTVFEIAEAADAAKATFFNYFPTKEYVLAEYHDRMAADILGSVEGRSYATTEEAVQDVLRECAAYAVNDPVIGRVLLRVMFSTDVLLQADNRNEERLQTYLESLVTAGVDGGELRPDLEADLFLSLLVGTLSASVTEWVAGNHAFDLEGRLERKVDLLFRSARAQPRTILSKRERRK